MYSNQYEYRFDDFTYRHFEELLVEAKKKYRFSFYDSNILTCPDPIILWRHDVDISMHEALELAKIENRLGVKATYFLLMHSEFYNLFEKSISDKVREIIELGHSIGLHFDPSYYKVSSSDSLEEALSFEKEILERNFDVKVNVFSFHNPVKEILEYDEWSYSGLINTYSADIKRAITYCSDSNGYWRFSRMMDVILNDMPFKLQALTHPEWWTKKILSPKQKVWRSIDKRAEHNKLFYTDALKQFNRKVIDWS